MRGSGSSYIPLSALTTTAFRSFQIPHVHQSLFWEDLMSSEPRNVMIQQRNPLSFFSRFENCMFCGCHCMGGRGGHVKDTFCGLWSCLQHLYTRNTNTVPNIQHVHTCTKLSRYYSGCHNTVISCFVSIIYVQTNVLHCLQSFIYSGVHFINKRKL